MYAWVNKKKWPKLQMDINEVLNIQVLLFLHIAHHHHLVSSEPTLFNQTILTNRAATPPKRYNAKITKGGEQLWFLNARYCLFISQMCLQSFIKKSPKVNRGHTVSYYHPNNFQVFQEIQKSRGLVDHTQNNGKELQQALIFSCS